MDAPSRNHPSHLYGQEMKLLTPDEFCAKYFSPGSKPAPSTLRKWLRGSVLPARKIGGTWFIDDDKFVANGDSLVERALKTG